MAFREVTMLEVKEVLRLWLLGLPKKGIAAQLGFDVKTVRRYLAVARARGVEASHGLAALDDDLVAAGKLLRRRGVEWCTALNVLLRNLLAGRDNASRASTARSLVGSASGSRAAATGPLAPQRRRTQRSTALPGEATVATYISLLRYTEQGIRTFKEGPTRVDNARKAFQAAGAELKQFFLAMGKYDMVIISEAPNDETVARIALSLGAQGNVRTQTMRVFTEPEYRKIIDSLK